MPCAGDMVVSKPNPVSALRVYILLVGEREKKQRNSDQCCEAGKDGDQIHSREEKVKATLENASLNEEEPAFEEPGKDARQGSLPCSRMARRWWAGDRVVSGGEMKLIIQYPMRNKDNRIFI